RHSGEGGLYRGGAAEGLGAGKGGRSPAAAGGTGFQNLRSVPQDRAGGEAVLLLVRVARSASALRSRAFGEIGDRSERGGGAALPAGYAGGSDGRRGLPGGGAAVRSGGGRDAGVAAGGGARWEYVDHRHGGQWLALAARQSEPL